MGEETKLDLKELLDLLEEEETGVLKVDNPRSDNKKHVWKPNKDVERFIRKVGIEEGEVRVPTFVIYYTFVKWATENWSRTWGNTEFFRTFRYYFKQRRTGKQRYYMLNPSMDMSEDFIDKSRKYYQKWVKSYNRGKK